MPQGHLRNAGRSAPATGAKARVSKCEHTNSLQRTSENGLNRNGLDLVLMERSKDHVPGAVTPRANPNVYHRPKHTH